MNFRQALNAANGAALTEHLENHFCLHERQTHFVQGALVLLREGPRALGAFEALKAVSVLSRALTFGTAVVASHREISLEIAR